MNTSQRPGPAFDAAAEGFRMPGEFEPHAATWMAWPCRPEIWGEHLPEVKRDYARLARTISDFEPLNMIARPADAAEAARICGSAVRVVELPLDDSWARDSGPTFITNARGEVRATAWAFNAWGAKYHPFDADARLARSVAALAETPVEASTMVLEGGSILSDGAGTVFTTESCLLNPNRNPGMSKADIEIELKRLLGAQKIVWLPGDETEKETDGHIDGLLALVAPGKALIESSRNTAEPRHAVLRENRRALELATDAGGRRFELWPIEEAEPGPGPRFCRSYVNLIFVNGAVIAPQYGQESDRRVRELLETVCPDRRILMLPIGSIAMGGGGFHCITQQQPCSERRAP